MSQLLIVSNRITVPTDDPSPGGLAVGVLDALQQQGGTWLGWNGDLEDGAPAPPLVLEQDAVRYATTALPRDDFDDYYYGYCNEVLWPLLHSLLPYFQFRADKYQAYLRVNEHFAHQIEVLRTDDDVIWIHDYHLIPIAQMLRERGVRNPIGFFYTFLFHHSIRCVRCPFTRKC